MGSGRGGSREFAGQTFADSRFGAHYDPDESRTLSADAEEQLISTLRHALTQPAHGSGL